MKEIKKDEFKEKVLGSKKVVVFLFYADWCKPCIQALNFLRELYSEDSSPIECFYINTDNATSLAGEHRVSSIPVVLVFKKGKEANRRFVGLDNIMKIEGYINSLL